MGTSDRVHPVDEVLPLPKMFALGLQHVLVMYASAITIPLIIGSALKLPREDIALLISADLFTCGIVTILQSVGIWGIGIRLPVIMGVTFIAVGPMLAIGANPELGLLGIFGSALAAGLIGFLIAPLVGRLLPLFPSVVTGIVILMIGISLMRVGINWAGGGLDNPNFGKPLYLGMTAMLLLLMLAIVKFGRGFMVNLAVLLGIIVGFLAAIPLGEVNFAGLGEAKWVAVITPFQFGWPKFDFWAIATMTTAMLVVFIESTGVFLGLGQLTGKPIGEREITRGLRADGLGASIGAVFNTFPYTTFSQNMGLVALTGVRSRWVTATAGVILIVLGLVPKMGHVIAAVPLFVLGAAGILMFGLIVATGIKVLSAVDYTNNKYNLYIVAISVAVGMIPLVSPGFFKHMPKELAPLLHSGILISAITAVALNLILNGLRRAEDARAEAVASMMKADTPH
ncbi:nucleobase:cation symporter-2 family protein [Phreatobacter stygius]|nr:nucleobase:cation symporter-2 family protein [Phreatobacter stygius]